MNETAAALIQRTDRFSLDVLRLVRTLATSEPGPTVKRQLSKSATSVAANHRSARRSRSHAEFISRIAIVAEEADESLYWLRLVRDAGLTVASDLGRLVQEADELTAIFSAMVGTARRNRRKHCSH
ncbi:MAG TPA: four helix bundle protein [Vicinamibacterales bacterium]|nr:four helix bundle protein [Vicinamibacterales bacterium]